MAEDFGLAPQELPVTDAPSPVPVAEEPELAPLTKWYFIERPNEGERAFLYVDNTALLWTSDTSKALRFPRAEDAKQIMSMFGVMSIAHVAVLEFPL